MAESTVTKWFVASFPNVLKVDNYGRYSITMIFDKNSETVAWLKKAVEKVAKEKWGGKAPKKFKYPIMQDGTELNKQRSDEGKDPLDGYDDKIIVTAKSQEGYPPKVINYPDREAITDPMEIYGGCVCRANISVFAFDNSFGKGVSVGLNSVQKLRDGKRLGGSIDPLAGMDEEPEIPDILDDDDDTAF